MTQPNVPTGPITFGSGQPALQLRGLRQQLEMLSQDPALDRIDEAIKREDWPAALGLLEVTKEHSSQVLSNCNRLISRINGQHYCPLLQQPTNSTEVQQ